MSESSAQHVQRQRLREALRRKLCDLGLSYGLPPLDAGKLADHETQKLLSLARLKEHDLEEAEQRILAICQTMGLRYHEASEAGNFRPRDVALPIISKGSNVPQHASDAGHPPRLHRRDLDFIPAPSVVKLIQSLASDDFLRAHNIVGHPAELAQYTNKEVLYRIYNLLYDTDAWKMVTSRTTIGPHGAVRRAEKPAVPELSPTARDAAAAAAAAAAHRPGAYGEYEGVRVTERRRKQDGLGRLTPPWQVEKGKVQPSARHRQPYAGAFMSESVLGGRPVGIIQDATGSFVPAPLSQVQYGSWARAGLNKRPELPGRGPVVVSYSGREGDPSPSPAAGRAPPPAPSAAAASVPAASAFATPVPPSSRPSAAGERNYVRDNVQAQAAAPMRPSAARAIIGQAETRPHPPGQLPKYLIERKIEADVESRIREDMERQKIPQPMPEEERLEMLAQLQDRHTALTREMAAVSLRGAADGSLRPSVVKRQESLELQLREVESAIRHFSRRHVYLSA